MYLEDPSQIFHGDLLQVHVMAPPTTLTVFWLAMVAQMVEEASLLVESGRESLVACQSERARVA